MYNLYNAPIKEYTVGEDEGDTTANAQTLKDWIIKRHPQVQVLLANHVDMQVWDRIARNRKKGYDELLRLAPGSFTRADLKHARSRALPHSMANVAYVKWTGDMKWEKGQYQDPNSCLFEGYSNYLHNMVNVGITMLAFHDEEQKNGIGRIFVGNTHGKSSADGQDQPTGLYCFEGVGHLGEMGYMPPQSGGDIIQQLTNLPHKISLGNETTWVGKTRPTDDERVTLSLIPSNYNMFREVRGIPTGIPPAFQCSKCKTDLPELSARIHSPGPRQLSEDELKELENQVEITRHDYNRIHSEVERTSSGNLSAAYKRRVSEAAEAYKTINDKWKDSRYNLVPTCMECFYHDILST